MADIQAKCFVIRHSFRDGIYLGRDGQLRDFPAPFSDRAHAEASMETLPPLLRPDWTIVECVIQEASHE